MLFASQNLSAKTRPAGPKSEKQDRTDQPKACSYTANYFDQNRRRASFFQRPNRSAAA